ncbi:16S rRNA (guanine(966)-N(2))-methyltransferase RsmD [candidate division WOR-1 bacterium RIFOXYB2_FULL_37_13]|uniref:16S rRNA (Guanine(966)-N(2))-methyltransferase RsmD n=1 Tax=candidate division WOR-1 bacterium RIFOXYB2_FULL_37_13 TaxID=1802579 RepID=A0A1F4SH17_UNCSA|nr:MAG: 16S rRNA (guanine(966)-N(2))-methyltransferase RsmD [candidate division WOR-1 bacterium RIFOXYB2_FULL_37_13]
MRIISGSCKGRKLKVPKTDLRPLSDQAKESLFNILAADVPDSDFLDLFAGSGSVGIEALSRGARLSIFVEKDKKAVSVIRENLEMLELSDRAELFLLDVLQALKILYKKRAKFDIIFLGAPYGSPFLLKSLQFLGEFNLLKPNGIIIAEHRAKSSLDGAIGHLDKLREHKCGDTLFSFYKGSFDEKSGISGKF